MKKKRAITNYTLICVFIFIALILTFVPFPILGTYHNFTGLGNIHLGLELGGGVKNTYDLEVADWYEGNKLDAYNKAVDRVQYLLNKHYSDAKVYLTNDDKMVVEVPDTSINDNYLVGLIEMKAESGEDADARVTGADIKSVEYTVSGTTHGVYIEFTDSGKEKFRQLTSDVASSDSQTMYIYMDKDYDNPFSQPTVEEENSYGYTFISGSGITNKETGEEYARKIESAMIGVNMSTELDEIDVPGVWGDSIKIVLYVTTCVIIVASIVIAYVLFKQLGLVSSMSLVFALMVSVIISAICDLQVTFAGWLGFLFGYILNFVLHMYYLNVIKQEYAKGKKFIVSFTSGYKGALFTMLDTLLLTVGTSLLLLIVPSSSLRMFTFNFLITIPATAFTALYLNKVVAVNYTAFNLKNEKKVNFAREEGIDEVK